MGTTAGSYIAGDDVTAGDDLTVGDDATISGDLAVTGSITGGGWVLTGSFAFTGTTFDLDPTGLYTLNMDASMTATTTLADNLASAYLLQDGAAQYIDVDTVTGSEKVDIGNAVDNPALNVLGSGQITLTGNVDCSAGLDVSGAGSTFTGGALAFTGTNLNLDPTGTFDLAMDAAQTISFTLADNLDAAWNIADAGGNYIQCDTQTGAEVIELGNAVANVAITQLGTGQVTFAGNVDATVGLDVTGGSFTATGGDLDFTGVNIDLDPTGTFALDMDAAQTATITVADALASALLIQEGANAYLDVTTTNASEAVAIGNATTNPTFSVLGSGQITLTGNVDCSAGLDVSGAATTITGGDLDFTGVNLDLDPTGTFTLDMDAAQVATVTLADNLASAFSITDAGGDYINIDTSTGTEILALGNAVDNPAITQLGAGQVTFPGNVDATGGLDVSGANLTSETLVGTNLTIDSTNAMEFQIGAVGAVRMDDAAISGFAAATDVVGQDIYLETQDAGPTPTAARVGGLLNIKTGDGASAANAVACGAGGSLTLLSGDGGVNTGGATGEAGGDAGAFGLTSGAGGSTDSTGAHNAGHGADITITGGAGGNATGGGSTGNGGDGGNILLAPGAGGTTVGGAAGSAGVVGVTGAIDASLDIRGRGIIADGDPGSGIASTATLTNATVGAGGVGAATFINAPNATAQIGWLKVWVGTSAYVVPYWDAA